MEITDVRCVRRRGTMEEDPGYEERLARPTDVYPEFREEGSRHAGDAPDEITQHFIEIESDAGITGLAGPVGRLWAHTALDMASAIEGQNPLATEKILDVLYGRYGDGTEGLRAKGASAIDVALWDLRGKHYDAPVHELLGGPTRTELPCYASMLGHSVEPDRVRERAAEFQARGFPAQKWFFRHGPGSGEAGIERNVALVAAAREATDESYDLMFDCWRSWGLSYAMDMLDRLAPHDPRWVEQPLDSQEVAQYARLAEAAPFPIAGGEHDTTRWTFQTLLDAGALDVLQPDTYYAGGITELHKICALGSTYDVPVIPHGHSVPANVQLIAAQPPTVSPLVEFLVKRNARHQFFFENPVVPEDGIVAVPDRPGIGVSIDESAVDAATEVTF